MDKFLDGFVVEFVIPCAMLGGFAVVFAGVYEVVGRVHAKVTGRKYESPFA